MNDFDQERRRKQKTNKQKTIGSGLSVPDCATEAQLRKTVKWRHMNHLEGQKQCTYFLYHALEPECLETKTHLNLSSFGLKETTKE